MREGYALLGPGRGQRAALQHQPGALCQQHQHKLCPEVGRSGAGRAQPAVTATLAPTPAACAALPAHGPPAAAAGPGAGAGASPARGTCPLRDPAQDAPATRNRNPARDLPLREVRASHAGSGELPFRPFPLAWCGHGRRGAAARPPSRAAAARSSPAAAHRGRPRTRSGAAGSG